MNNTGNQEIGNAVVLVLRTLLGAGCISGLLVIAICICCTLNIIGTARAMPTSPPVDLPSTPLVKVGSFPIQDVETYATPKLVLWDIAHSKYPEWDWHYVTDDQDIRDFLESEGYKFDLNKVGVLNLDISSYSLIVLELGCCANKSAYTSEEAEILYEYVNSGGSLLLFGENAGLEESQNLNIVSKKFGIELPYGDVYGSYHVVERFANHPITYGLASLNFQGAGPIGVSPPATPVAWNVEPPPQPSPPQPTPPPTPVPWVKESVAIAVAEVGKGKVVAVGDSDFITKEYLGAYERRFILNTFKWLTEK